MGIVCTWGETRRGKGYAEGDESQPGRLRREGRGEKSTTSRRAFSRFFFLFDGILYLVFEFGIKA